MSTKNEENVKKIFWWVKLIKKEALDVISINRADVYQVTTSLLKSCILIWEKKLVKSVQMKGQWKYKSVNPSFFKNLRKYDKKKSSVLFFNKSKYVRPKFTCLFY